MAFVGERSRLSESEVRGIIEQGDVPAAAVDNYIHILRQHGFLGIRISPESFDYGGTVGEMRKADILASKLQKTAGLPRGYEVHPAYRRHLLIEEAALS